MSWEDYSDYYEPSEFDEKVEEFKDYLRESVKEETQNKINRLESENKRLRQENTELKAKNKTVESENKTLATDDIITKLVTKNITKENVYKLIEGLFKKTFEERTNECPDFWHTFVNYYNNRNDIITLLKYADVQIPSELETIVLPHEWNEELLDKFFDTMSRHYNCNGTTYEDNLRFWTYRMAAKPFDGSTYSSYDEIPWQFVLRNPLLNTEKYALKIVKAMNNGGHGLYFSKICTYQELSESVLNVIVNGLEVNDETKKGELADFLEEHIEMVTEKYKLDYLYPIIASKWRCEDTILKMPKEYQIKYVKSLKDADKKIRFLKKTKLSKKEKTEVMGEIF